MAAISIGMEDFDLLRQLWVFDSHVILQHFNIYIYIYIYSNESFIVWLKSTYSYYK